MKNIKKVMRFFRMLLLAFMFAVSMVIGIAPVIPKRKEPFEIEVKIEESEKGDMAKEDTIFYKADS